MFRLWAKIFKENHLLKDVMICNDQEDTRTHKVFQALDEFGLSDERENVKKWYDGFVFGNVADIYNPWSITNFLSKKEYRSYWVATSSNGMVSKLIQTASSESIY